jgi:predicted nucleic acid-binding protein
MEVLQGAKTEKDFKTIKKYLDTQTFYDLKKGKESYADAAKMYFELRKKGMTVKSTMDCLIAQVAIENDLFLLHSDQDFLRISRRFPIKIWEV